MKIAVLADIHANLEALEAVLIAAANAGAERIICLGDIVGYGPDPLGCIYRLKEVEAQIVLGNHDQAVLEPVHIQSFNLLARPSLYQAGAVLGEEERDFLRQGVFRRVEDNAVLSHANPLKPEEWEPLLMYDRVAWCMSHLKWSLAFVGHTHEARIYCKMRDSTTPLGANKPVPLTSARAALGAHQYLVCVGSVGQPRDGDWRSAYTLWDPDEQWVELQRVEYPVQLTQQKIDHLGYPNYLAERLAKGE